MCPKSGIGRKRNWEIAIMRESVVCVLHIIFIKLYTEKNVIVRTTWMILTQDHYWHNYDQQTIKRQNNYLN